ncbi:MAG: fimbrial biogenesis chaperone [Aeromonadaceae bacterium]
MRSYSLLLLLLLLPMLSAQAGIVINGTRVIYPAERREVTLQLNNTGDTPALVQSWIDSGNINSQPSSEKAPFIILPPVTRVDGGQSQTLRIMHTGTSQAKDRETLYWLNVLDIPPELTNQEGKNYLQFAIRSRLKLFFRPKGLKSDPAKVTEQLRWHLDFAGRALLVDNESPYHVTLDHIQLAGQKLEGDMVAPFSRLTLPLPASLHPKLPTTLQFSHINDFGARQSHSVHLAR